MSPFSPRNPLTDGVDQSCHRSHQARVCPQSWHRAGPVPLSLWGVCARCRAVTATSSINFIVCPARRPSDVFAALSWRTSASCSASSRLQIPSHTMYSILSPSRISISPMQKVEASAVVSLARFQRFSASPPHCMAWATTGSTAANSAASRSVMPVSGRPSGSLGAQAGLRAARAGRASLYRAGGRSFGLGQVYQAGRPSQRAPRLPSGRRRPAAERHAVIREIVAALGTVPPPRKPDTVKSGRRAAGAAVGEAPGRVLGRSLIGFSEFWQVCRFSDY